MKHWEHFSWFKPAKEDFHFERDAKELHIKKHILDLTGNGSVAGNGILKGVLNALQVYVDNPAQFVNVKVKTGEAYIQGEKVEIGSEQTVALTDVETEANIIWLKYKLIDSSDPDAIRIHPITGAPMVVWKDDSFELGATKESQYVPVSTEIKLARVAKVSGQLVVTHDYRAYLKIDPNRWSNYVNESDFYVSGAPGTGRKVLVKQAAPPVPTRLTLSTNWDQVYRKTGVAAGLMSVRPAYIKADFGDKGSGTASGNTFTWTTNRVGNWTTNEWANHYLTCSDGNSWKVISNTANILTLESTAIPVTGNFWLGPNAAGYKFIIQILDPVDDSVKETMEAEAAAAESPVKMEYLWHGLTPDIKYSIRVASRGGWFQDEWSTFCSAQTIIAGGAKVIPDDCANTVKNVVVSAEDDGIRISWDIDPAYTDEVAGVEVVHTDDGTEPNFDTLGHRKVYTDRKTIVLPSKHSTDTSNITVKAKIRAVDKAGRHCVTPISITPIVAKKYLGDVADIVTEIKTARGNAASLNNRLSMSLNADGRSLAITEIESEVADARGSYANLGARMAAILAAGIDWKCIRIVAQDDTGHYNLINDAINSIVDNDLYIILVMPGTYQEIIDIGSKKIGIIGIGHSPESVVKIDGRIKTSGSNANIFTLENLYVMGGTITGEPAVDIKPGSCYPVYVNNVKIVANSNVAGLRYYPASGAGLILNHVRISNTNNIALKMGPASDEYSTVKILNCDLSSGDADTVFLDATTGTDNINVGLINTILRAGSSYYSVNGSAGAASRLIVDIVNVYLVNAQAANGTNLTVRYGTAENVSCVRFTDFMPWI